MKIDHYGALGIKQEKKTFIVDGVTLWETLRDTVHLSRDNFPSNYQFHFAVSRFACLRTIESDALSSNCPI